MRGDRRFGKPSYYRSPFLNRRGSPGSSGDGSIFCLERDEYVEKSEACSFCPKYGAWDGANLQCRDRWKWEQRVDHRLKERLDSDLDCVSEEEPPVRNWEEASGSDADEPDAPDSSKEHRDDEKGEERTFEDVMEERKRSWWNRREA